MDRSGCSRSSETRTASDIQRYHREAERLFRAQGNNSGRQRMRADATLRPTKAPRGLILSTGEDVPRGLSLRARLLVIEVSPGDLDWDLLSGCQADAAGGQYAQVVSALVQWLAPKYEGLRQRLRGEVASLRQRAFRSEQHRRIATIVVELAVGWGLFLEFAQEASAITPERSKHLWAQGWKALGVVAAEQAWHQRVSDPARLFLDLLSAAVTTGRAHLAGPGGREPEEQTEAWGWRLTTVGAGEHAREEWRPGGERVGWVEGEDLYLDPRAAFTVAFRFGKDGTEQIPVTLATLTRRLNEQRLLVTRDERRGVLTVRRTLEGKRREVLHLAAGALAASETDQPDQEPSSDAPGVVSELPNGQSAEAVVGLVGFPDQREGEDALDAPSSGDPDPQPSTTYSTDGSSGLDRGGWPVELPGRSPRGTCDFTPCSACHKGTFVTFGGVPFCGPCAHNELARSRLQDPGTPEPCAGPSEPPAPEAPGGPSSLPGPVLPTQ